MSGGLRLAGRPAAPPSVTAPRARTMNADMPKLALALEYADIAAGLYIDGGSDHAARLLAGAAEKLLGDLGRLVMSLPPKDEVQHLLTEVALSHEAPEELPHSHISSRNRQPSLDRVSELGALLDSEARQETSALLRACWYTLESLGLEAVAPDRLGEAIEMSTIYAPD